MNLYSLWFASLSLKLENGEEKIIRKFCDEWKSNPNINQKVLILFKTGKNNSILKSWGYGKMIKMMGR